LLAVLSADPFAKRVRVERVAFGAGQLAGSPRVELDEITGAFVSVRRGVRELDVRRLARFAEMREIPCELERDLD
jgi:hypothetical protein